MKKLIIAAAATLMSASAFAGSMTIEFAPSDGDKITFVLDTTSKTATANGQTGTYTWDEASNTLCGDETIGNICVTFDEVVKEAGTSTGYTRSDGVKGTATLVSISE